MSRRRQQPRAISDAVRRLRDESAPRTPLAAAQAAWAGAVGPQVAKQARPVAERDGVLTVACTSATWAQELDLMQLELLESLATALAPEGGESPISSLRFTADAARHGD